ncbi:MAG: hypothetical protein ACK4GU_01265 [Alishewanella aestuarii]
MTQTVQLTFNGVTAEIKPVVDGMYDLNDIWRTFRLPEKKQPSQWRHRDRRNLEQTGNLQVEFSVQNQSLRHNIMTLGTKKALFMYAAWCDYEFHDAVFTVFQLVTEGKAEEALTASQKVVVDFGLMRERHGADMDVIKKRQDDGKLKLSQLKATISRS